MAQSILVKDYTGNFNLLQDTETKTVTIANGASTSTAFDVSGYKEIAVVMPSAWTTATVGLEASTTLTGTYTTVHDGNDAIAITVGTNRTVMLSNKIGPLLFVRLKASANQDAARTLTVLLSR